MPLQDFVRLSRSLFPLPLIPLSPPRGEGTGEAGKTDRDLEDHPSKGNSLYCQKSHFLMISQKLF